MLTSQGTPFIHSGQEYGRTKQFRDPAYKYPVSEDKVPNKAHLLTNEDGTPFDYPYFIHDSYDSSDAVNHFDWIKATDAEKFPENAKSRAYMKGLISLRKSTDAFTRSSKAEVDQNVTLITQPGKDGVEKEDLVLGYQVVASNGDIYAVFVNADKKERNFYFGEAYKHLAGAEVVADGNTAGITAISNPAGVARTSNGLTLAPLTATILRIKKANPAQEEKPQDTAKDIQQEQSAASAKNSTQALSANAQKPLASGVSEVKEAIGQAEDTLPKTGTRASLLAVLGGFLIFLAGLLTFRKRQ